MQTATGLLAENVTNPLLLGQSEIVYRSCRLMLEQPDVDSVEIKSFTQNLTICALHSKHATGRWPITITRPIFYKAGGTDQAGSVEVTFNLQALRSYVVTWIILGIGLAGLVLVLQIWLYKKLSTRVGRPLNDMAEAVATGTAETLAKRDWKKGGITEIDRLNSKIQEMALNMVSNQKALQARERDRAIGELARQIAHDIRSPLGALKILKAKLNEKSNTSIDLMSEVIDRIENLAENLLLKSRQLPNETRIADICEVLERLCNSLQSRTLQKNISLSLDLPTDQNGTVYLNILELERVVTNLVENSIEAVPDNGEVTVKLESEEKLLLIVKDTGEGLPPEVEANLGTGRLLTTKPNGNGLGLRSVYETIARWSGSVVYKNLSGATFIITLNKIAF